MLPHKYINIFLYICMYILYYIIIFFFLYYKDCCINMSKKKRANQQKRKKKTEKKKNVKLQNEKNYNNVESERGGITDSLINDYHDTNFKKNFFIKSIKTDGNFLYRAVSDQLYNHEENIKR
ncbi:hypothetical protein PFDG_01442 [Plasmodium falciparum Dd2]|uniref:OTU domain-containing protein n=1 Tax=Plasmodium falciparum (isolate Dd2) TaxID=57267 RepID=A0A0L7LZT1_PLAF4|nr:hypothetical protein PFDG_01442 [Plasmodium falciparum Dd2]